MHLRNTLFMVCTVTAILMAPREGQSACHLWQIKEVFSNQSGDIQYIEMFNGSNFETSTNGTTLTANSDGNIRTFTLNQNLTVPTNGKHLLLATPGFANLAGGVTPDFTLPCGSFFDPGAALITVSYSCSGDSISFAGALLPADGANSLTDQNVGGIPDLQAGPSSPTNFAGSAGSLSLSACLNDGTCDACDDGLFCNGVEACAGSACVAGADPCPGPGGCDEVAGECVGCGNSVIDAGEDCDNANLGGETCSSQGFFSGDLACNIDCTFDTSACTNCGNDTIDAGEQCDGADLGGQDCTNFGFDGGTLTCASDCRVNLIDCTTTEVCGNGVAAGPEQCDGADLRGDNCQNRGFDGGTLACDGFCRYDTSGCTNCACGDNVICGAEVCDGSDLGGATCESEGFGGGTLACTACALDTSGCEPVVTPNGNDPAEEDSGCGCRSGHAALPLALLLVVALASRMRRRREET